MADDPYTVQCQCCGMSSDEGSLCWQCEDCPPDACLVVARLRRFQERQQARLIPPNQ
jgi:hypothetical protein